jgi:hypothetical protein
MKLILVNQRYGHTRTIVIRGWMKGLLSLCLLGAPLALACLGYELALADSSPNAVLSQNTPVVSDELNSAHDACPDCLVYGLFDAVAQDDDHEVHNSQSQPVVLLAAAENSAADISTPFFSVSLAVFSHGRPIDPARYAYVTLI